MSENRLRILIVDDHEENRYVLRRVLERAGYECDEATTGRAGLEKVESLPSIVILDVHLPDVSGFDVSRKIKQNPRTAQVAILQISASFVGNEDKAKALEMGAEAYLTHPIDPVVLLATVRSLLRLKAAEDSSRKSALQWQTAFDVLSEGLAFVNGNGELALYNRAFGRIAEIPYPPEQTENAAEMLERVLGTSAPLRHKGTDRFTGDFRSGERTVQLAVDPIRDEHAEAGKVLVLTDITDRKLAEYALLTAEKLAATGKMANTIAHEINNPLEALVNLIYLAQTASSLGDAQRYLSHANEELNRIGRITKQALSFHRDTQHAVPVDVGGLVGDVVSLYEKSAVARGVEIVCERQSSVTVHGFPGQLRQVFGNLVRNATEAAPPSSQVVIRVRAANRTGRSGTRITIHDRGAGIPERVQARIFDPFFTMKELKGSGLGLWVSKALIVKHRGTIRFRSSTRSGSSGTTFEVFLPGVGVDQNAADAA